MRAGLRGAVALAALCLRGRRRRAAGDRELGEYLSSECVTCHQLSGQFDGIPSIVGPRRAGTDRSAHRISRQDPRQPGDAGDRRQIQRRGDRRARELLRQHRTRKIRAHRRPDGEQSATVHNDPWRGRNDHQSDANSRPACWPPVSSPCRACCAPRPSRRVVVIGGGPGGATVAKYVARDSQGAIDVTMVEPLEKFITCFHSNLVLGDIRSLDSITHRLQARRLRREARPPDGGRDRSRQEAGAAGRRQHARLRPAGGRRPASTSSSTSVPGYSEAAAEIMPHGWKPGAQTLLLKKQLDALEDGSTIVMLAPPNPYRCPPGPYERVSVMAHGAEGQGPHQVEDHRHRSEGQVLQDGAVPGGLAEALSGHDRMDGPEDARRRQVGRSRRR